jgi:hypothetical protein
MPLRLQARDMLVHCGGPVVTFGDTSDFNGDVGACNLQGQPILQYYYRIFRETGIPQRHHLSLWNKQGARVK